MTRHLSFSIEYHPQLVEAAVLHVIDGHSDECSFREARDRIYEINDADDQEAEFQDFHQSWFQRLELAKPVQEVLDTWPLLKNKTYRCLVFKAQSKKSIGSDLYVGRPDRSRENREMRTILIQLNPGMFCSTSSLLSFLRHELLHIVDMVNPEFEYKPDFARSEAGFPYDPMLLERYKILWDITIDGRLAQKGWNVDLNWEQHWNLFKRLFPGESQSQEKAYTYFRTCSLPTHSGLSDFARNPETCLKESNSSSIQTGRCSLCHFPASNLSFPPVDFPQTALEIIRKDYPNLSSEDRVCQQCLDLFESRASARYH